MTGNPRYIYNLDNRRIPNTIGNKALNLRTLSKIGVRIPKYESAYLAGIPALYSG